MEGEKWIAMASLPVNGNVGQLPLSLHRAFGSHNEWTETRMRYTVCLRRT